MATFSISSLNPKCRLHIFYSTCPPPSLNFSQSQSFSCLGIGFDRVGQSIIPVAVSAFLTASEYCSVSFAYRECSNFQYPAARHRLKFGYRIQSFPLFFFVINSYRQSLFQHWAEAGETHQSIIFFSLGRGWDDFGFSLRRIDRNLGLTYYD